MLEVPGSRLRGPIKGWYKVGLGMVEGTWMLFGDLVSRLSNGPYTELRIAGYGGLYGFKVGFMMGLMGLLVANYLAFYWGY